MGPRDQALLVARGPPAVVVELGLDPLQRVEVLVALPRQGRELVRLRLRGRLDLLLRRLVHYELRASSSTTSYSPSSTTSSSAVACPFPGAEAWACAVAWA